MDIFIKNKEIRKLHNEVISKEKDLYLGNTMYKKTLGTDFVLSENEENTNNTVTVGPGHEVSKDFYACIQMNTCRAFISHLVKSIR